MGFDAVFVVVDQMADIFKMLDRFPGGLGRRVAKPMYKILLLLGERVDPAANYS